MVINLVPQDQLYKIFDNKNPLYKIAINYPKNMCWLTTIFYVSQFLGYENNKKLHKKLSKLLYTSISLMSVSEDNGAMLFPKKFQLSDNHIKAELNNLFKEIKLKIRVKRILSNISYNEISYIEQYLKEKKELLTIVKNIDLSNPNKDVLDEVPNHVVLIKELEDTKDGKVRVVFIDPSIGKYLEGNIGVHAFVQWIQYIWVLERKHNIIHKFLIRK